MSLRESSEDDERDDHDGKHGRILVSGVEGELAEAFAVCIPILSGHFALPHEHTSGRLHGCHGDLATTSAKEASVFAADPPPVTGVVDSLVNLGEQIGVEKEGRRLLGSEGHLAVRL